jgi:NarL family two-component system response regulator LiaR
VADDHPAIVAGVRPSLEAVGLAVVGQAGDGDDALRIIEEHRPHVALVDVSMPRLDGIEVARQLFGTGSSTAIVLYTGHAERALLLEALDAGVRGFMLKETPLGELAAAVRHVAEGGTYVDAALREVVAGPDAAERLPALTKREREVLRLLADGARNEQVGAALSISPLTVSTHVKNIMDKLEADTRTAAVASALRGSLIS